jgi:hypothetical protein
MCYSQRPEFPIIQVYIIYVQLTSAFFLVFLMFRLEKCAARTLASRPPLEWRDRSAWLGHAHTTQDWCSLLSTPRAMSKHRLGVRALCCALQVLHLSSYLVFWIRGKSFWRRRSPPRGRPRRGLAGCQRANSTPPPLTSII